MPSGQVARVEVPPPEVSNPVLPAAPPAIGSSPVPDSSGNTDVDPQVRWGMSKDQVKQIEDALEHSAIIAPNEVVLIT